MASRRVRSVHGRGIFIGVAALVTVALLTFGPGRASAATPVLEFAPPGGAFPVEFEAEGGEVTAAMAGISSVVHCKKSGGVGLVTGPRSAEGVYWFEGCETQGGSQPNRKCTSPGAEAGEIESEEVDAELAFVSQANHEVGMVLAPLSDLYLEFSCEGILVKAYGPFVSPVGPVNQLTSSFSAKLISAGASQLPSTYENANGALVLAVPTGTWEAGARVATGVSLAFAITTYDSSGIIPAPLEIRARTAAEVEAETRQREEAEAAAKKRQEEEAAAKAAAAKRQQEEAAAAEAKKRAEEEAKAKAGEKAGAKKPPTRAERLAKALKQCRTLDSKEKRANCRKAARNKYGPQKKGNHKKGKHQGGRQ